MVNRNGWSAERERSFFSEVRCICRRLKKADDFSGASLSSPFSIRVSHNQWTRETTSSEINEVRVLHCSYSHSLHPC